MTTSSRDMRYGRQGGRIVPFDRADRLTGPPCVVCGRPVLVADADRHFTCQTAEQIGSPA